MMSEKEIKIIDILLEKHKPKICLEWGSGGSTLYFPKKFDFIEKWTSVEHDSRYFEKIKNQVTPNVELLRVPLHEYLSVVMEKKFDFILIDGLMRGECLMFSQGLLNENGFVLMHDSGRMDYQKAIKSWDGQREELSQGEIETRTFAHRGLYKFSLN